jgi:hypothetical protein
MSIFQGGAINPSCPYVRAPMSLDYRALQYTARTSNIWELWPQYDDIAFCDLSNL